MDFWKILGIAGAGVGVFAIVAAFRSSNAVASVSTRLTDLQKSPGVSSLDDQMRQLSQVDTRVAELQKFRSQAKTQIDDNSQQVQSLLATLDKYRDETEGKYKQLRSNYDFLMDRVIPDSLVRMGDIEQKLKELQKPIKPVTSTTTIPEPQVIKPPILPQSKPDIPAGTRLATVELTYKNKPNNPVLVHLVLGSGANKGGFVHSLITPYQPPTGASGPFKVYVLYNEKIVAGLNEYGIPILPKVGDHGPDVFLAQLRFNSTYDGPTGYHSDFEEGGGRTYDLRSGNPQDVPVEYAKGYMQLDVMLKK